MSQVPGQPAGAVLERAESSGAQRAQLDPGARRHQGGTRGVLRQTGETAQRVSATLPYRFFEG